MSTILRKAQRDDAERIADIYLASRKRYLPYAPLAHTDEAIYLWVREKLIPTGNVIVALQGGCILGFMATSEDGAHGWIDHLYLDPEMVGRGLGSVLVEEAKSTLRGPIRLYTFQDNNKGRRFYSRHGFREIDFSDGSSNEERVADVLLEWP